MVFSFFPLCSTKLENFNMENSDKIFKTEDQINLTQHCHYCMESNTLVHRYFTCSWVKMIWEPFQKKFSKTPQDNEKIDWFFNNRCTFIDEELNAIIFITVLWSIHAS